MLPAKFQYVQDMLNECSGNPLPVDEAVKLFGTHEAPGVNDNSDILAWARELGVADVYKHDSVPWCGLAMGLFMARSGFTPPKGYLMLRALEWETFGTPLSLTGAMFGDVLVFHRTGGGHVGLYVGETTNTFAVLGGNEGDAVSIVAIVKERISAVRRPPYSVTPTNARKIPLTAAGTLSTNES